MLFWLRINSASIVSCLVARLDLNLLSPSGLFSLFFILGLSTRLVFSEVFGLTFSLAYFAIF